MKDFLKKSLMAGVLSLLPIAGTIWLLKAIISVGEDFSRSFIPKRFHPENLLGFDIPGIGLVFALMVLLLAGMVTRLYFGRKMFSLGDRIFHKIPLGRGIYKAIKQFLATIAGEEKRSFRKVVLVEFPSPGSYCLAFMTGVASGEIQEKTAERMVYVFLPTTPNPTTGFLLIVPERKLIPLEMPVDEAFKLMLSGGVVSSEPAGVPINQPS